jgi:group II intron reverse transcriptase/maturase
MKGRKQKTRNRASSQKLHAERGKYAKGFTSVWITENNTVTPPERDGLLEKIICPYNPNKAYLKVCRNKGSHGVDGLKVDSLRGYLLSHGSDLIKQVRTGNYNPNPVRRVHIPKEGKKKRPLGIPTVVDRVIQQAIHQVLSPIYEKQFSDNSFGFRPRRSAHGALEKSRAVSSEGYRFAVDMDMEKFFDTVNHSKLIEVLSRTISDGRVISLIHKYLNSGVVVNHRFENTELGVPQGGPLSPLLSNVMLHELDKELEYRGHRFVRYADDFVIFCKSRRAGERIKESISRFLKEELYLRVNESKTKVVYLTQIKFLGYSFYKHKGVKLRIHPDRVRKLKVKMRKLTSRSNGWGLEKRKKELSQFIKGWLNYYKFADISKLLKRIDAWYRRRLRMVIWKQWKRIRTRFKNLKKLGVNPSKAWQFANTRKSYWRTSISPILASSITDERLATAGFVFFLDYYKQVRKGVI